ncbi:MAG: M20/M25/M40 family metallo-hydrolase [Elusimicrobiaceae bacterium]|nr:M20/M25/M40 family metallo-hydrolase [Elusimicrobiaceae bacterium]
MTFFSFLPLIVLLGGSAALAQEPQRAQAPDYYPELKRHFSSLLGINTAQPRGNELEAARYLYGVLDDERIDWEIYESTPGRAALAAFLRAPKNTGGKPLLLLSHLDTVGADAEQWQTPPFTPVEKNGEIYARGASDCKDLTAINLMTLVALKRSGAELSRDVIMLATPDEEAGSGYGLAWLLETRWKGKPPGGYALNEGGGVITDEAGKPLLVFVETAGKMYLDLRLTAEGTAGHSALPPRSNSIYSLAAALAAVERLKLPVRVTPTAEKFFRSIYAIQGADGRTTFDLFFSGDSRKAAAAAETIAYDPFFNAQLRDTVTPTVVRAGQDNNAVPAQAWALLNCRLLYDSGVDDFVEQIRKTVAPYGVTVSVVESPRLPFPAAMTQDDELYRAITAVAGTQMPGVAVAGGMIPGTTDSEFLRRAGVIAYGLGAPKSYGELDEAHAPDEKIRLDSLYRYFDFVYGVAREFAVVSTQPAKPVSGAVKPAGQPSR